MYINAGAGSGKTYRLTETLTQLIKEGKVKPEQVILTTFSTTKAANEFKEKAKAFLFDRVCIKRPFSLTTRPWLVQFIVYAREWLVNTGSISVYHQTWAWSGRGRYYLLYISVTCQNYLLRQNWCKLHALQGVWSSTQDWWFSGWNQQSTMTLAGLKSI